MNIQESIANYKIEDHLGNGGFSDVWLCTDNQTGNKYAIKIVEEKLANQPKFRDRFINSVHIQKQLKHPNIVQINELINTPNSLALVMEYVEGANLDEFILKNYDPATPLKLLPFFEKILDALEYAHQNKVVHRDIKPSNILISKTTYSIKLIDFDAVKDFNVSSSFSSTHFTIGTYSYMSPEQVADARNVTPQSDIYSLGLLLFYLLNGKPFYDKNSRQNVNDMLQSIKNEKLPQISLQNRNVPSVFDSILFKATEKDASNRFRSCADFKHHIINQLNPYTQIQSVEVDIDKTIINVPHPKTEVNKIDNSSKGFDPDKTFINQNRSDDAIITNRPKPNETRNQNFDKTHFFDNDISDSTQFYQEKHNQSQDEKTEIFNNLNNHSTQKQDTVERIAPHVHNKSSLKALDLVILIVGAIVFMVGMFFLFLK